MIVMHSGVALEPEQATLTLDGQEAELPQHLQPEPTLVIFLGLSVLQKVFMTDL